MGVRGLMSFVQECPSAFSERIALTHGSRIVIDGMGLAYHLYAKVCIPSNKYGGVIVFCLQFDRLAGEYENFSNSARKFIREFLSRHLVPIVVFDGLVENMKRDTKMERVQNELDAMLDVVLNMQRNRPSSSFMLKVVPCMYIVIGNLDMKSVFCC